jgi:hypothetical protein
MAVASARFGADPRAEHAMKLAPPASIVASSLLASVLASGCTVWIHEDDDHPHDPPPPPFDLWENEPNDSHCCPDDVGTLFVGGEIVIGGHIQDDFDDPFDGFAFESGEPIEVHFVLEPVGSGADLDLCVWDPVAGAIAFCFDSPSSVEIGQFEVTSSFDPFHLVVASFVGDAEYRLTVWAEPVGFGALGAAASTPDEDLRERLVPFDRYGPDEPADEPDEPEVLDPGRIFEIDTVSGTVLRRDLVVREDGIFIGPAR